MHKLTNSQKEIVNRIAALLRSLPEASPDLTEGFFIIEEEPKTDEFSLARFNRTEVVISHALEQAEVNLELVNKMLEEK